MPEDNDTAKPIRTISGKSESNAMLGTDFIALRSDASIQ